MQSIHGCSIAVTIRLVISACDIPKLVCTEPTTQSSWASSSSS